MRILLDTHALLWAANKSLSPSALALLEDTANELYFSTVSIWEIELKRRRLNTDPKAFYQNLLHNGYQELSLTARQVLSLSQLPALHSDPFDRILLAQALSEQIYLLTDDEALQRYSEYVDCIINY
ncbi:MAG: type II toxin-antitoxin system VapC family toxin [Coriobacteriales bacterium]|jgi:PIN domain nuclease of toxin-antitoxin system|nr:type II toxin-antitoxin system VapC family toxin [Coriobacteriales bacterium]